MHTWLLMERLLKSSIFLFLLSTLSACVPSKGEFTARVAPTSQPKAPTVAEENGFQVAHNALRTQKVQIKFDPESKMMKMNGTLEYLSVRGKQWAEVPVNHVGVLDKDGFIVIKSTEVKTKVSPKVAAKATCLSEAGTCHAAFIDIYVYVDGVVYTQQLEYKEQAEVKDEKSQKEAASPVIEKAEDELNTGADEPVGELGPYVGTPQKDIEKILEVKPNPPKKIEPPAERGDDQPNPESAKKTESGPSLVQAIGAVNNGRLENAIDVYQFSKKQGNVGFEIIRPERKTHFATNELAYILSLLGKFTHQSYPERTLSVGDLSRAQGGELGRHKSHQTGLDIDVAYYFDNRTFQGYFASAVVIDKPHGNWMIEAQWNLFKNVVQSNYVDRIFVHGVLKKALCQLAIKSGEVSKDKKTGLAFQTLRRLIPDAEHNNHFHLRVKCSSAQIRCRQMAEPVETSGCF